MLTHSDLKKGVEIIIDGEPYEILEANPLKMAQRRVVIQSKIKNLITGNVLSRNFHQGDTFEEVKLLKSGVKFLYSHPDRKPPASNGVSRNRYFFCEKDNPTKRFDLTEEQIGPQIRFLKQGQVVEGVIFEDKIINISLPIKIKLRVTEAPPGVKGDRSQSGTKQITLETGAKINAPLFIKEGDIIEVNTDSGEYVRRIE
jgi:elongation factor P